MTYDIEFALYYALLIGFHSVTLTQTKDAALDESKLNATAGELLLELMIKIAAYPNQWNKIHNFLGNVSDSILLRRLIEAENLTLNAFLAKETTTMFPTTTGKLRTAKKAPQNDNNWRTYSKQFTYQRVTGQPILFDRNPKPYVAVSIIAPKRGGGKLKEDLSLEKELQLLKPWSHQENLQNMAAIRSRWYVQN